MCWNQWFLSKGHTSIVYERNAIITTFIIFSIHDIVVMNILLCSSKLKLPEGAPLRERWPYLEFFWSVFFRIWTEYQKLQYLSIFIPNAEKYRPEKLQILRLFTYCYSAQKNRGFY